MRRRSETTGLCHRRGSIHGWPGPRIGCMVRTSILLAVLVATAAAAGAEGLGRLEGRAQDETGKALPGVTVEVQGVGMALDRAVTTDGEGRFAVAELPAGRYQVVFRLPAFATSVRDLDLAAGGRASVEATLRVALTADVLVTGRRTFRSLTELDEPVNGLLGLAEAGSVGVVTARQIEERPAYRAG